MTVSVASTISRKWTASTTRRLLSRLLAGDLNFHKSPSNYASHSIHAFAAKFPPQLPRVFIEGLTDPRETVLDPMMGSGTAIVEAFLANRRVVGFDIDLLALLICRVKTMPVDFLEASWAGKRIVSYAYRLLEKPSYLDEIMVKRYDRASLDFIEYWFSKETQRQLMALLLAFAHEKPEDRLEAFLKVVFSSIIITKSGGVSLAYDLAHSRPHRVATKIPKDAIKTFEQRLLKCADLLSQLPRNGKNVQIGQYDCRQDLPLNDNSVQLIVTSPPYANAIDYMRAHKFSLVWFGESIEMLSALRAQYIGSERTSDLMEIRLPSQVRRIISLVEAKDTKRGRVLTKYFQEMGAAICQMHRVLEPGRACVIVVGSSEMRGVEISTHQCLSTLAEEHGFEVVEIAPRKLDRNRRMMPAGFLRNHNSQIESRMHEEYVVGLVKSPRA